MLSIIVSNPTQILYRLPPGKPDSSIPCTKENLLTRPRVPQAPQKDANCFYYAANLLRYRIGKAPSDELLCEREKEKCISAYRRKTAEIEEEYRLGKQLLVNPMNNPATNKSRAQAIVEQSKRKNAFSKNIIILEKFVDSKTDSFSDFVKKGCESARIKSSELLLAQLNKGVPTDEKLEYFSGPVDLSIEGQKTAMLKAFTCVSISQAYEMHRTAWLIRDPIQKLIQVLKSDGPLLVRGSHGRPFYETDARQVETIDGQSIMGWKPTDKRHKLDQAHCIVVVGAKEEAEKNTGFVYYVDPTDGSDPLNPAQQKIYKVSYARFTERSESLGGMDPDPELSQAFAEHFGCGLHGPATKPDPIQK